MFVSQLFVHDSFLGVFLDACSFHYFCFRKEICASVCSVFFSWICFSWFFLDAIVCSITLFLHASWELVPFLLLTLVEGSAKKLLKTVALLLTKRRSET